MNARVSIETDGIRIRDVTEADVPLLSHWLSDPHILEWYEGRDRPHDEAMVREHYLQGDHAKCIVEYRGRAIGYEQFYALDVETREKYGCSPDENVWGMDQFIGEVDLWGHGLGTSIVEAVVAYLFAEQHAERVVMDPMAHNIRALRCYEKAGFTRVRTLPHHELHEGELRDCWLIERRRAQVGPSAG